MHLQGIWDQRVPTSWEVPEMATSNAEAPTTSNAGRINIKVKTLGQASYDLEVAEDVRPHSLNYNGNAPMLCLLQRAISTVFLENLICTLSFPRLSCRHGSF